MTSGSPTAAYCLTLRLLAEYAIPRRQDQPCRLHAPPGRRARLSWPLLVLTPSQPRKSHRLTVLRSLAENLDPRLIEAWPRDTRAARRAFAQLQRAYVEARYSPAYEITPDELAWIIYRVKHLHAIAAAICAEHLAGNGKGTA